MNRKMTVLRWTAVLCAGAVIALGCATSAENVVITAGTGDGGKVDAKVAPKDAAKDTAATLGSDADQSITPLEVPDTAAPADAGLFAGELFDPTPELATGATCASENDVVDRRCGKCGNQQALCVKQTDGSLKVGTYGGCRNENMSANACLANAQRLGAACGLCGKTLQTCDVGTMCEWSDVSCEGEVAAGCEAGSVRHVAVGCSGDQVQRQECSAACVWKAPEACAVRGADELALPTAAGVTTTFEATLWGSPVAALAEGACPASLSATMGNPQYTKIHNPTAASVRVNLWVSRSVAGALPDVVMAVYNRATVPPADADRMACAGKVVAAASGLLGSDAVVIPAGGDIIVLVSSKRGGSVNAPFVLNAQLDVPLNVPSTVGALTGGRYVIRASGPTLPFPDIGTCPGSIASSTLYPVTYVTLTNPETSPVTVTAGETTTGSRATRDIVIMGVYNTPPTATTVGSSCIREVAYECRASPVFVTNACVENIVVPASSQLTLMFMGYDGDTGEGPTVDVPFDLKVVRK